MSLGAIEQVLFWLSFIVGYYCLCFVECLIWFVCYGLWSISQVKDGLGEHFYCTGHPEQVNHTWPRPLPRKLILHFSGKFTLLFSTLCAKLSLVDESTRGWFYTYIYYCCCCCCCYYFFSSQVAFIDLSSGLSGPNLLCGLSYYLQH